MTIKTKRLSLDLHFSKSFGFIDKNGNYQLENDEGRKIQEETVAKIFSSTGTSSLFWQAAKKVPLLTIGQLNNLPEELHKAIIHAHFFKPNQERNSNRFLEVWKSCSRI